MLHLSTIFGSPLTVRSTAFSCDAFPLLFGCYDDSYVIFDPVYLLSCLSPSVVDLMGVALSFFVAVFATGSVDSAS